MKAVRLAELLGEVREDLVQDALPGAKKRSPWRNVLALAACLALVLAIGSLLPAFLPKGSFAESVVDMEEAPAAAEPAAPAPDPGSGEPEEPTDSMIQMPHVIVDGTVYYISSHLSSYDECPADFKLDGVLEDGEFAGCSYYTSEQHPQLVYVYAETNNRGELDSTGTVIPTERHLAYLRFVDETMRGNDFICVDGQLYTSMWNGWDDVDTSLYESIEAKYGIRIEGEAPEGFVSAGKAAFAGWDMWPTGTLSSNTGEEEVFVDPAEPDVVLVATTWHTIQGTHTGFNVYLRYDP